MNENFTERGIVFPLILTPYLPRLKRITRKKKLSGAKSESIKLLYGGKGHSAAPAFPRKGRAAETAAPAAPVVPAPQFQTFPNV